MIRQCADCACSGSSRCAVRHRRRRDRGDRLHPSAPSPSSQHLSGRAGVPLLDGPAEGRANAAGGEPGRARGGGARSGWERAASDLADTTHRGSAGTVAHRHVPHRPRASCDALGPLAPAPGLGPEGVRTGPRRRRDNPCGAGEIDVARSRLRLVRRRRSRMADVPPVPLSPLYLAGPDTSLDAIDRCADHRVDHRHPRACHTDDVAGLPPAASRRGDTIRSRLRPRCSAGRRWHGWSRW